VRIVSLIAFLPVVGLAGVPVAFQSGNPAKASEVNQNFKYLDSAVADHEKTLNQKADQSAVLGIVSTVGAKVDTAALTTRLGKYMLSSGMSTYATTSALTTGLGAKVDTSKLTSRLGDYAKASDLSGYAKTSAMTTALAAKPDRSEVMVVGKTGAEVPTALTVTGTAPKVDVGYSQLASGRLTLYTDTTATSYGFPAWHMDASTANGFRVGRYGGGPNNTYYYFSILPGTGITLSLPVKTTDSLVVGKNLRVTGKITAVATGSVIPDYVFDPGYQLAPLAEVEAFAQKNRHLPDVPSAAEIGKGGLDLTEMNLTLLRKVEELTLHAIAQEKRIQVLESQLAK